MTDLLHWYARIHGPRALRIVEAARAAEFDGGSADAASAAPERDSVLRSVANGDDTAGEVLAGA
ncbi:hypothetical protein J2X63_003458 [Agromyces sp. 3263]|uniref:hypothetical protein n=1 Tax=Agromyces sp. 3263 TaxID=2817750 RepID=UPI002864F0F5|nr:hypothetical protein [Agromyces sp. 3263]MDR6907750.1 hypothetical protein [Agromyces sp. 3263]